MALTNYGDRIASLKQELLSHHERRRMVETDPELTAKERTIKLGYHDWIIDWLRERLIDPEGH